MRSTLPKSGASLAISFFMTEKPWDDQNAGVSSSGTNSHLRLQVIACSFLIRKCPVQRIEIDTVDTILLIFLVPLAATPQAGDDQTV